MRASELRSSEIAQALYATRRDFARVDVSVLDFATEDDAEAALAELLAAGMDAEIDQLVRIVPTVPS